MNTYPECYLCIFRQAATALRLNEPDQDLQVQTLKKVLGILERSNDQLTPSEIAGETNRVIRESLGVDDLYKKEKEASHILALQYEDDLRDLIGQGADPLEQGLKVSAAGNIIDIIHDIEYDLWDEVEKTVDQDLMGGGLNEFKKRLDQAPYLLYMADNVGETIFDRIFIETLDIPVKYAVKSGPILNDATLKDALAAGIDLVAEVLETGSSSPGTILSQCTDHFRDQFQDSALVLSKGQANYETLDNEGDKVFFLLRTKCPEISRHLDIPIGNLVLKQGKSQV